MNNLVLVKRSSNGSTEEIFLSKFESFAVDAGSVYTILDNDTKAFAKNIIVKRKGIDLEVEVDGEVIVHIEGFYTTTLGATFSIDGSLTPNTGPIVSHAEENDDAEEEIVWQGDLGENSEAGGGFPIGKVALGAAGVGLLALALSSDDDDTTDPVQDTSNPAPGLTMAPGAGGITNDNVVNVALAVDVATWEYSLDGGTTWSLGTGTSFSLDDGASFNVGDIQVRQTDTSGNVSPVSSNPDPLSIDATAPDAPVLTFGSDDSNSRLVEITVEDAASWDVSLDGGMTWTEGTGNSFELEEGTEYAAGEIQARQSDAAGNVSPISSNTAAITLPDIDTTAPTVTITDDTEGVATGDVTYTFTFNEAVAGFTLDNINVTGGTKGTLTTVSATQYTLVVTPAVESTTDITVDVAADVATDAAGNNNTAATQSVQPVNTVTPDTTAPTVTISDNTAGVATAAVTYTFTFSEAVTGFAASDVQIAGGSKGTFTSLSATEYTLVVFPAVNSTSNITVDVAANVATDNAGNSNTAAIQSVQTVDTVTPDTTAPAVSITDDTSGTASSDVTYTFTFSEPVTGFTADDINITGGTKGTFTAVSATEYTLVVTPATESTTDITVDVAADVATDGAGNDNSVAVQSIQAVDTQAPAAPGLALAADTGSSNSDGITNDATVNVTLAVDADSWEYSTNNGASWTTGTGTSFELADNSSYAAGNVQVRQTDAAGNVSTAGSNAAVITTDMTVAAPGLALVADTGSSNSDGITNDATVNVTLAADVASWEFGTDSGATWSAGTGGSFELANNSTFTIGAVQARQTDTAGNVSAAGSNAAAITTDMTVAAPGLALATDTGSSNSDGITNDATVNVTLAADVASWEFSTDSGATWSAGTGGSFELADNSTFVIGAVQARQTDTAGNVSAAGSNAAAITTDMTAPTVSIVMADTDLTKGEISLVTFTFSEAPVDFTAADITAPNGAISGLAVTANPLVYEATFTPTATVDTTNIMSVNTGYTDVSGNSGAAANSVNYTVETVDTSIVVFDLVNGKSSNHSGRSFLAGEAYTIYILVDSDSRSVILSSGDEWAGGINIGGDDTVVLVGDAGPVIGPNGGSVVSTSSGPAAYSWGTVVFPAATLTVVFSSMAFFRYTASGGFGWALWTGTWSNNPNIDNTFNDVYLTTLPTSVTLPV